jgi:alanine racemase
MTSDREPPGRHAIEERLAAAGLPPLPRLAWLEVDLDVLAANARRLRDLLPPGADLGVVVKADGYGHGMEPAARAALRGGARLLAVATLDEALALREAGIAVPILVLYPVPPACLAAAFAADLDLVVADEASVATMAEAFRERRLPSGPAGVDGSAPGPRVHLGIDSGLRRGGIEPEDAVGAARHLLDAGLPRLAGTWSHLATPEDPGAASAQVERYEAALAALAGAGIDPGTRHLDATGGLLAGTGPAYDLVRVGLAFYGVVPPEVRVDPGHGPGTEGLRPAITLRARAATIAAVPAGASVGYGGTWTAVRPSVIATLPVGYADGWARAYAAGSWGIARGRRVPLVGRVSSDALALDVTDVPGFGPADEVVLLGEAPAMGVHDLAGLRGSIAWEVLDALAPRISRVYLEGGRPIGVRTLHGRTRWAEAAGA